MHRLNIRAVAAACGVSVGSVYNYFPTKAELVGAVVEDFWHRAFSHEELARLPLDDFFASYRKLYAVLAAGLGQFEKNWLQQLALLDAPSRQLGKQREGECFRDIKKMLSIMLDSDPRLRPGVWNASFTKEALVDFLFDSTMRSLEQGEEEPAVLLELLRRALA